MPKCRFIAILVTLAAISSMASASIELFQVAADGDGVITCVPTWTDPVMTITGNHLQFASGHVVSDPDAFTTDSALDPTITMNNVMENDTGIAWTSYNIKFGIRAKNAATALSGLSLAAGADLPENWTADIMQQLTLTPSYTNADDQVLLNYYIGEINYSGPTALAAGGTLDVSYTFSFQGATSYMFWQETTPVPEPATMALLAVGLPLAFRRRLAR